jgi:hypothetical protein
MMIPRLPVVSSLVAVTCLACSASCERPQETSQEVSRISAGQEAIRRYSERVSEVDALQQRFTAAWRKANELADPKALKEAVDTQVLPALDGYTNGLKTMPTDTQDLALVHKILVDGMDSLGGAFRAFAEGLTGETRTTRYAELLTQMDALAKAEATYLEELKSYYAKHHVDLVPHPPARAPDAK